MRKYVILYLKQHNIFYYNIIRIIIEYIFLSFTISYYTQR